MARSRCSRRSSNTSWPSSASSRRRSDAASASNRSLAADGHDERRGAPRHSMMPTEPPFRSVAMVGLGLIGGSIALGLRRVWPQIPIVGVDRPDVLAAALSLDVITSARERIGQLHECELIVLAVPVPDIVGFI